MAQVPATSLNDDDARFVDFAATQFPCNLPFVVLSGTNVEINAVINKYAGTPAIDPRTYNPKTYAGPLLAPVKEACKAFADKEHAEPVTLKDMLLRLWHMDRQSRYLIAYNKYFG